jgi:hypothetical protein
MHQLPKPYLLLSSICICLLIVSCRVSKFKHPTTCDRVVITEKSFPAVLSDSKASKFKASIDVLKNHLTGIIIVKKTDSLTTHIIFVTEIGMKMFDFEWKNNEMNTAYVFEPLNKESLIKSLKIGFKQMLLLDVFDRHAGLSSNKNIKSYYDIEGEKHRYIIADTTNGISSQQIFNKNKKNRFINYTFDIEKKAYTQIKSTQFGLVKIKIELNRIEE